jgi:putative endonuclease
VAKALGLLIFSFSNEAEQVAVGYGALVTAFGVGGNVNSGSVPEEQRSRSLAFTPTLLPTGAPIRFRFGMVYRGEKAGKPRTVKRFDLVRQANRNESPFRGPNLNTAGMLPQGFREAEESAPPLQSGKIRGAQMKPFWVYIMSNKSRRLYTGFSSDLSARVIEHKLKLYPNSFTAQYCFDMLVWYEQHSGFVSAREREVEIKGWRREKKPALILADNPDWADLSLEWQEDPGWKLEPEASPRLKRKQPEP